MVFSLLEFNFQLSVKNIISQELNVYIEILHHQVNQIRDSLAVMGDNSTAFSLPQVCVFLMSF